MSQAKLLTMKTGKFFAFSSNTDSPTALYRLMQTPLPLRICHIGSMSPFKEVIRPDTTADIASVTRLHSNTKRAAELQLKTESMPTSVFSTQLPISISIEPATKLRLNNSCPESLWCHVTSTNTPQRATSSHCAAPTTASSQKHLHDREDHTPDGRRDQPQEPEHKQRGHDLLYRRKRPAEHTTHRGRPSAHAKTAHGVSSGARSNGAAAQYSRPAMPQCLRTASRGGTGHPR